jgi:hypothetical protein
MVGSAVEHRESYGMFLDVSAGQHGMRPLASVFAPEQRLTNCTADSARLERSRLIFWSGEHAQHWAQGLELSRGIVTEHLGEAAVGRQESAVQTKEAQAYGSAIGEASKQGFGAPQRVFDATARRHGFLEVSHLLSQAGDLVDQLLLRAMIVAHGKM